MNRLLENAKFNWRLFVLKLSGLVHQNINSSSPVDELFFVLDDTITEISGKLVEGASYIYDHVSGKAVLGFQKLVLGIFNGSQFIPVSQRFCSSKKKPAAKSKAVKYDKIPKAERIAQDSPGAVEREQLTQIKLRNVKKNPFKQSLLTVCLSNSKVEMKIVFIQNDNSNKWHAFAATESTLSSQKILEYYSQRV